MEQWRVWLNEKLKAMGRGSAQRLADHLERNASAVSRMRQPGGRRPNIEEIPKIADFFGEPMPISEDEIDHDTFDREPVGEDGLPYDDREHEEPVGEAAGLVDGKVEFKRTLPGSTPELSVQPGAGSGRINDDRMISLHTGGIATGHRVTAEWVLPAEYIRGALNASPGQVVLLPMIGDSMNPTLESGDRLLVDTSQAFYVGEAIYVISDNDQIPRVKRLQKVSGSRPPRFHILSDNPTHKPELLPLSEFRIIGRVVGRFTKV